MIQIVSISMFEGLKRFYKRKSEQWITPQLTSTNQIHPAKPAKTWGLRCCWTWGCGSQHVIYHTWFDGPGNKHGEIFSVPFWEVTWKDEDNQNDGWILILIDNILEWRRHPVHEFLLWYSNIPNTFFSKSTIALILMWLDLFSILHIQEVTRLNELMNMILKWRSNQILCRLKQPFRCSELWWKPRLRSRPLTYLTMLRLVVLCAVGVSLTSVFVAPLGGIEHTTRATPRVALHAKEASDRDGKHGNTNETPMMAILVGLALGDLTGKIFRFFHQKSILWIEVFGC